MKKVLTSPYFYVPLIVVGLGFLILWWRWNKCRKANGIQPNCVTTPCDFIFANCSFWTGKPVETITPPSSEPISEVSGKYSLVVSNRNGATVYTNSNGIFTATAEKIPYQTSLMGKLSVTSSGTWYKTNKGWVGANDVSIPISR